MHLHFLLLLKSSCQILPFRRCTLSLAEDLDPEEKRRREEEEKKREAARLAKADGDWIWWTIFLEWLFCMTNPHVHMWCFRSSAKNLKQHFRIFGIWSLVAGNQSWSLRTCLHRVRPQERELGVVGGGGREKLSRRQRIANCLCCRRPKPPPEPEAETVGNREKLRMGESCTDLWSQNSVAGRGIGGTIGGGT